MPTFFCDFKTSTIKIPSNYSERIRDVLIRNLIPPDSVLIRDRNGIVVSEDATVVDESYFLEIVEGYNIIDILNVISATAEPLPNVIYSKKILTMDESGQIEIKRQDIGSDDLIRLVEDTFSFTASRYNLFDEDDHLLLGLSGGIDSTSLLSLLIDFNEKKSLNLNVFAVTYEDFPKESNVPMSLKKLANTYNVHHEIISEELVSQSFNLKNNVSFVLNKLMNTKDRSKVMYIDHHITRRALEIYAHDHNIHKILLGLHATDILAGLLNMYITGYYVGDIPSRNIGEFTYLYPLSYHTKKELKLYLECKHIVHSSSKKIKPWEIMPIDRVYYYYLADLLQSTWPGAYLWFFNGLKNMQKRQRPMGFKTCNNCKGSFLIYDEDTRDICDVCDVLSKNGFIK